MGTKEKILLISIGGSSEPVIFSIKRHKPDKIIFFVSAGSREKVSYEILPAIIKEKDVNIPDHEFVQTPDAQNVGVSTEALLAQVPIAMQKLTKADRENMWPDIVDYTGGTKAMSAALIWASSRYPCTISYIGSASPENRTKDGLGIVINGREVCFINENPWDKIGFFEIEYAMKLFDIGRYSDAAYNLEKLYHRLTEKSPKQMIKNLGSVCKAFFYWDIFRYEKAYKLLSEAISEIEIYADNIPLYLISLKKFYEEISELVELLYQLAGAKMKRLFIYDLLANAKRRAELEGKYEDAVVRCYSALEKNAKYELLRNYGIDTSNARPELLPDELRDEYIRKYTNIKESKEGKREVIEFGLSAAYKLLEAKGNPYGKRFTEIVNIHEILSYRNNSILGHGSELISYKEYEKISSICLYIMNIKEEKLPRFPLFLCR